MKILPLLLILTFFIKPANAYIDPGIGSMFVQGLIAAIMLIPFYGSKIIQKIKELFKKDINKDNNDD